MEQLNDLQKIIFNKYLNKENIFISGPGGSGKSYIIKYIYNHAEKNNKKIKVCALTGCAAILLKCKATTIHSFSGIGIANKSIEEITKNVIENKQKYKNWKNLELLIIDEVSMLSLKIFLVLDNICKKIFNNKMTPFGGLQIIFSGDFYQLPPVYNKNDDINSKLFCFEHQLWNDTFKDNQINLNISFRHSENNFIKALNYIRKGKITKNTLQLLESRLINEEQINEIKKTKILTILSPIKKNVDNINIKSFELLDNNLESYTYNIQYVENNLSSLNITNNKLQSSILNSDFESLFKKINPSLKFEYEFLINNIIVDKKFTIKIGTYVMCIANIDLQSNNQIANGSQGIVVAFKNNLPMVKFNNIEHPIQIGYYIWKSENNEKIAIAQIPLIYAWAITIHKSQGITLENALIDIGSNVFEYGQTYVALSRVKSINGLYLSSLNYNKINANPKVKKFYND